MTFIHPEIKTGEIFFTNATRDQFKSMKWVTKRLGAIAYNGNGEKLNIEKWYPVFLLKEELKLSKIDLGDARKQFREIVESS